MADFAFTCGSEGGGGGGAGGGGLTDSDVLAEAAAVADADKVVCCPLADEVGDVTKGLAMATAKVVATLTVAPSWSDEDVMGVVDFRALADETPSPPPPPPLPWARSVLISQSTSRNEFSLFLSVMLVKSKKPLPCEFHKANKISFRARDLHDLHF